EQHPSPKLYSATRRPSARQHSTRRQTSTRQSSAERRCSARQNSTARRTSRRLSSAQRRPSARQNSTRRRTSTRPGSVEKRPSAGQNSTEGRISERPHLAITPDLHHPLPERADQTTNRQWIFKTPELINLSVFLFNRCDCGLNGLYTSMRARLSSAMWIGIVPPPVFIKI